MYYYEKRENIPEEEQVFMKCPGFDGPLEQFQIFDVIGDCIVIVYNEEQAKDLVERLND